ncbi:2Fe-2S iron-sulfur cluster binding domain-containing protein [Thermopolyspora sp. NPDC052614]|uniref:2Fe-2S iron-sulfur cluster-binding protein n=1 Tax=Thermopolyspora sp. NPDC052614 TaxID=3155682 RepID=UPI0034202E2E
MTSLLPAEAGDGPAAPVSNGRTTAGRRSPGAPSSPDPAASVTVAGVTVPLRPGETILAGLYRAGYAYRIGCRRGGCGLCAAEVTSGEVTYDGAIAEDALPPATDPAAPPCLTCRAVPVTDVVIRLAGNARFRCVSPMLAELAGAIPRTDGPTPRTEEQGEP